MGLRFLLLVAFVAFYAALTHSTSHQEKYWLKPWSVLKKKYYTNESQRVELRTLMHDADLNATICDDVYANFDLNGDNIITRKEQKKFMKRHIFFESRKIKNKKIEEVLKAPPDLHLKKNCEKLRDVEMFKAAASVMASKKRAATRMPSVKPKIDVKQAKNLSKTELVWHKVRMTEKDPNIADKHFNEMDINLDKKIDVAEHAYFVRQHHNHSMSQKEAKEKMRDMRQTGGFKNLDLPYITYAEYHQARKTRPRRSLAKSLMKSEPLLNKFQMSLYNQGIADDLFALIDTNADDKLDVAELIEFGRQFNQTINEHKAKKILREIREFAGLKDVDAPYIVYDEYNRARKIQAALNYAEYFKK